MSWIAAESYCARIGGLIYKNVRCPVTVNDESIFQLTRNSENGDFGISFEIRSENQHRLAVVRNNSVEEFDASERATASNPHDLPKSQAAVAYWLSKKYKVAPEPLSVIPAELFPEMMLRCATVLPPMVLLALLTMIPPNELPRSATPLASVPM